MSPINTSIAFILRDLLNFNYNIEIYNAKKQLIYKKQVNSELSFHVDTEKNLIKWLDFHENELKLLSVRFEAFDVSINLKFLMTRCAFEANRKEYFVDIVKKDEVEFANKFMTQESMEIEESVQKDYNEEIVFQEEFSFCKDDYKEEKNQENEENKTFVQAKVIDRSFVSKGCQLSVYKTDNEKGEKLEVKIIIILK